MDEILKRKREVIFLSSIFFTCLLWYNVLSVSNSRLLYFFSFIGLVASFIFAIRVVDKEHKLLPIITIITCAISIALFLILLLIGAMMFM